MSNRLILVESPLALTVVGLLPTDSSSSTAINR